MAELAESLAVDQIGAVGHFVAAMLQTAGLDGQSHVLNYMSSIIETVGALFYLVAVIAALISIALYGDYKKALYLLIAPGLFFFMLKTTVPAQGTLVRFGDRTVENSPQAQRTMIEMFINKNHDEVADETPQQISWFYVVYDNLVTSVVQGLIGFLLDTENRRDLVIAGRERVYTNILQAESSDPNFIKLIAQGVMGQCARPTMIANEASRINSDDSSTQGMRSKLSQQRIDEAKNTFINLDQELAGYLIGQKIINSVDDISKGVSCYQTWEYVAKAAHNEADLYRKKIEAQQRDTQGKNQIPEDTWKTIWDEVEATIGKGDQSGSVDSSKVNDVLAAILLRNNLLKNSHSALTSQIFEKVPFNNPEMSMIYENLSATEATGMTAKLVYFAAILPYIQGLFLMVLTVIYPFFCVFLLLPGRYMTFFMWMTIWLWVKSWDVGFAIIVFLKDFLWQFLSRDTFHNVRSVDWNEPSDIFEFVAMKDPIATPNTYSTIISLLTLAVPILTSELCMGASSLGSIFKSSTQMAANRFGLQHTKGANRGVASDGQYMLGREYSLVKTARAIGAYNNPGTTRSGVDRAQTFDSTQSRRIGNLAKMANFNAVNSPQGSIQSWATSIANNRPIEPISNVGKSLPPTIGNAAVEPLSADKGINRKWTLQPNTDTMNEGAVKGVEPSEGDL